MIVMCNGVMPLAPCHARLPTAQPPSRRERRSLAGEPLRDDEASPPLPMRWLELAIARWRRHARRQRLTQVPDAGWLACASRFHNAPGKAISLPPCPDPTVLHMSSSQQPRTDVASSADVAEPVRADDVASDDGVQSWYDSSYELRRGLLVIELDLDPRLTHGELVPAL